VLEEEGILIEATDFVAESLEHSISIPFGKTVSNEVRRLSRVKTWRFATTCSYREEIAIIPFTFIRIP